MELFLTLGLPVITIVGLLRFFKFKWPFALLMMAGLSALATFIVDFTYCKILATKCEPGALNTAGYFIHGSIVFIIVAIFDFPLSQLFTKEVKAVTR